MKIELRASNVPISESLETHIVRRIELALRRVGERVGGVVVRLVDLNGPRGGLDKRCRISAWLPSPTGVVIAEATDADAYAAVSHAAARLDDRVIRALTRRRGWSAGPRARRRRLRDIAVRAPEEIAE